LKSKNIRASQVTVPKPVININKIGLRVVARWTIIKPPAIAVKVEANNAPAIKAKTKGKLSTSWLN